MKRIIFLFVAITLSIFAAGQTIGHFRFDSTRLYKVGGNNELILENATKDTTGLLYNYYKGRTKFIKPVAVPGGIAFGTDTVAVAGGSGNDNLNQGAGYRWLVPSTQAIKTVFAGTNVTIDSTTNPTGITISSTGGSGTDNANEGAGFRLVIPSNQRIKTLYSGTNVTIDSTTNPTGITISSTDLGTDNTNNGAGYRLVIPSTQAIKTLFAGTNVTIDSTTNPTGITLSASGGSGTDNANAGAGYRLVKPADQTVKTLYVQDGVLADSTTNADGITLKSYDTIHTTTVSNVAELKAGSYHLKESKYRTKDPNAKIWINVRGYYANSDLGGGWFWWDDTTTAVANDGTVIAVTGVATGRWRRFFIENEMNVLWFGAKASNNISDNATNGTAFRAAKNALQEIVLGVPEAVGKGRLYIPRGRYFLDTTFVVDGAMWIKGDAGSGGGYTETTLVFGPEPMPGILVQPIAPAAGKKGGGARIDNIALEAYYMPVWGDTSSHGFKIKGTTILTNCYAAHWPGDGFNFETDAAVSQGDDLFGNSAFSNVTNCRAYNNSNGFHTRGGDANVITFNTCDATGNRRWGYWEDGFLGNLYMNCHTADNTYTANNRSQVTHGGKQYIAVINSQGIEPGVTSGWQHFWVDVGSPPITNFRPWHADTLWHSGGAYNSWPGFNSNSTFLNCYAEGGQTAQFGYRTSVWNGDLAALLMPDPTVAGGRDTRIEVVGGKHLFRQPVGHALSYQHYAIEIGGEGAISIGPNESYPTHNPFQKWIWDYDSTVRKFRNYMQTFAYTGMNMSTHTTPPSDYGIASMLGGMIEFPRGFYLNNGSGYRRVSMGTSAPANTTEWGVGSIIWRSPTSTTQSLGWRSVGTDTWEEIPWPTAGTGTDNANAGTGYRWVIPSTQEIKTAIFDNGLSADSTSTANTITAKLGGTLTGNTAIETGANNFNIQTSANVRLGIQSGQTLLANADITKTFTITDSFAVSFLSRIATSGSRRKFMTIDTISWTLAYDDAPAGTGSGTVNNGTQYQLGFYANTGDAISGNTGITTNANNRLMVSSADDEPFQVTTTGTGIASQYFPVASFLAPNMGGGDLAQVSFGKANSTNDKMFLNYVHTADGSANNYMNIEGYGAATPAMKITAGNLVGINISSAPLYNLHVNGTSAFNEHSIFRKTISMGETGFTGAAQFYGTISGIVTLSVNDAAGTWTYKLPNAAPAGNGYFLKGNTDGTSFWDATGGGSGTPNTNAGSGYRWLKPDDQAIKTLFGVNLTVDSATNTDGLTVTADTLLLATRAWRQKGIDSLMAVIPGTVTSVATSAGTGITGGTITSSGTISADTLLLGTRAWRQKGIDSLAGVINVIKNSKGITLTSPTSTENIVVYRTTEAITVDSVMTVMIGTTPSVTFVLNYGASRSTADGTIVASNTFDTGDANYNTTGFAHTLNTTTIPGGSYIWFTTSAVSGTINDFNLQIIFR